MNYVTRAMLKIARTPGFRWVMSDELYLKMLYKEIMGKKLNLDTPKSFNEKIQWLKLYDRNPLYTKLVDKYEVKKYVSNLIGEQYIIPTINVWDNFDDIDFDSLPDRFVLKCTHDCGSIVVCKDKANFKVEDARALITKKQKVNYFWGGREWPYKNVRPRIIAEEYMEDSLTSELRDYKFFCFDGEPKALFIATDRQNESEETKFDFFDMEFNHLNISNGHPNSYKTIKQPISFEKMRDLAMVLSKGFPHVRVDFYEVNGQVYFGELTFSHWSGFVPFEPEEWDLKFGSWIKLPKKRV